MVRVPSLRVADVPLNAPDDVRPEREVVVHENAGQRLGLGKASFPVLGLHQHQHRTVAADPPRELLNLADGWHVRREQLLEGGTNVTEESDGEKCGAPKEHHRAEQEESGVVKRGPGNAGDEALACGACRVLSLLRGLLLL